MKKGKYFIERTAFGVCTWLGDRMGISTRRIRLFFIYTSFLTLGSPLIVYLVLAFWMNMKQYMLEKRSSVWDL